MLPDPLNPYSPAEDDQLAHAPEDLERWVLPTDSLEEQSRKADLYFAEMVRREREADEAARAAGN